MNDQLLLIHERHEAKHKALLAWLRVELAAIAMRRPGRCVSADDANNLLDNGFKGAGDRRWMGALWKGKEWRHAGYVKSVRVEKNHGRAISLWRYMG